MIKYINNESIFNGNYQAIVNPVNCVGVMGAGLAKQFKSRYPDNFKSYKTLCDKEMFNAGSVNCFNAGNVLILNAATKQHWRDASKTEWVKMCLTKINIMINQRGIESLGLPAIGCGLGGLPFIQVSELINSIFAESKCNITVFTPQ